MSKNRDKEYDKEQANLWKDFKAKANAKELNIGWTEDIVEKIVEVESPETKRQIEKLNSSIGEHIENFERLYDKNEKLKKDIVIWKQLEQQIIEVQTENSTLKDKLADSLNAEQIAKQKVEDFKKETKTLKTQNTTLLKNALNELSTQ